MEFHPSPDFDYHSLRSLLMCIMNIGPPKNDTEKLLKNNV